MRRKTQPDRLLTRETFSFTVFDLVATVIRCDDWLRQTSAMTTKTKRMPPYLTCGHRMCHSPRFAPFKNENSVLVFLTSGKDLRLNRVLLSWVCLPVLKVSPFFISKPTDASVFSMPTDASCPEKLSSMQLKNQNPSHSREIFLC